MQVATYILKGSFEEIDAENLDSSENEEDIMCSTGHGAMAPAVRKLWRTFPGRLSLKQED